MIRPAIPSDRNRIVQLLADSRIAAGFDKPQGFAFPFDPAYAARLFAQHAVRSDACCLVYDVQGTAQGVLMAVAFEHPFGPVRLAKETVWWIDPAHRGSAAIRMLDAYESWSKKQGCAFAGMVGMGDDPAVATLYARRGYAAAEVHYLKPLQVEA